MADLQIPTYNNFKHYNFLDVLNCISRYNVSLRINVEKEVNPGQHPKTFEEELQDIEN